MRTTLLAAALFAFASAAVAGEHDHAAKPASKELEAVKALAGDWKGSFVMDGKTMQSKTSFRVTSGGSAVVETMAGGTPHEMTNVYHDVDGKMVMTHYCMIGNAPEMRVTKADGKSMTLTALKSNGIDPAKTPHMHGLAYTFPDKDHMTATWTSVNMGAEHEAPHVFKYERVP